MRTCGPCLSTNIAVAASTSLTVDISSSLRSSLTASMVSPRAVRLVFTVDFLLYPLVYGVFCNAWIRHGRYEGSTIQREPLPKFCGERIKINKAIACCCCCYYNIHWHATPALPPKRQRHYTPQPLFIFNLYNNCMNKY